MYNTQSVAFYKKVSALCTRYNISRKVVFARLKDGWSLEDAVELPENFVKMIQYNGTVYATVRELCNKKGINFNSVAIKLCKGWKLEDCIKVFSIKNKAIRDRDYINFNNEVYGSFSRLCYIYKKNVAWVSNMLYLGIPLKRLLTTDVQVCRPNSLLKSKENDIGA